MLKVYSNNNCITLNERSGHTITLFKSVLKISLFRIIVSPRTKKTLVKLVTASFTSRAADFNKGAGGGGSNMQLKHE